MDALIVRPARPTDPGVARLIETHFELMRATSPPESCHVQPADALESDDAYMLAASENGLVLGIGALKQIDEGHGELKSMHTSAAARGKGIARAILHGLLEHAHDTGLTRISLETGSASEFSAARALYASEGFSECPPFGEYIEDPLSVFMTRTL
jgi:putative acetyltransferase